MSLSRRTLLTAALLVGAGATTAVVVPAASADQPLRLSTSLVRNTDLDLGEPGFSTGDVQVGLDQVQRRGKTVGSSTSTCVIVDLSETRLLGHCTSTLTLPEGSITSQGSFEENPQQGPSGFTWAVTGGTGRYAGDGGEVTGRFRPGTDVVDLEIRFS